MVGNFFPKKFINTFNSYYCCYSIFKFIKYLILNKRIIINSCRKRGEKIISQELKAK